MIKRFIVLFFRNWTYEISFGLEIGRMVLINAFFTIFTSTYRLYDPNLIYSKFVFPVSYVFWTLNIFFSIGRLAGISSNTKNAKTITHEQLILLRNEYPTETFYLYQNKKYIIIKPNEKILLSGDIIIILIGRKQVCERKKARALINRDKND